MYLFKARCDIEAQDVGLKNVFSKKFDIEPPEVFGIKVGRQIGNAWISYFMSDIKNKNQDNLFKVLNLNFCSAFERKINQNGVEVNVTDYYILYDVINHPKFQKTLMRDNSFDYCEYRFTYELIFSDCEYKRYAYVKTSPTYFFGVIRAFDLECDFVRALRDSLSDIEIPLDDTVSLYFYNEVGEKERLEFWDFGDLENLLISVRLVEAEKVRR